MDEFDEAINEAEQFLETYPEDHNLLELLGLAYFYKEDYENGVEFLTESVHIEERRLIIRQGRGVVPNPQGKRTNLTSVK